MKTIYYLGLFILTIFSLISCEEEIEFTGEWANPKPILYAQLEEDSVITAYVARSKRVTDNSNDPLYIENATVNVYKDGKLLGNLQHKLKGQYISSFTADANSTYTFKAAINGFPEVQGESTVLDKVNIEKLDSLGIFSSDSYDNSVRIGITIKDLANEKNYYKIEAFSMGNLYTQDKEGNDSITNEFYENALYIYGNDAIGNEDIIVNGALLVSDELFDGREYQIKVNLAQWDLTDSKKIKFKVHHIDKHYFNYLRSVSVYQNSGDFDIFGEPTPLYSNIEGGGAGFVGSSSVSSAEIPISVQYDGGDYYGY
jgi:hypothetical protein